MSYLIAAIDEQGGLSREGHIPWSHTETGISDLAYFKRVTTGHAVLMGWNTYVSIGRLLPNRFNIIVTAKHIAEAPPMEEGKCAIFHDPDVAMTYARKWEVQTGNRCYIIGGAQLYEHYLKKYNFIEYRITRIPGVYNCDKFLKFTAEPTLIDLASVRGANVNMVRTTQWEHGYLDLLRQVLTKGHVKSDRTGTGTISMFSPPELRFSLKDHVLPVLTTKTVALKTGVIPELLWFISGSTDTRKLEAQGCNIWKGNTSREFLDKRGLPYEEKDMGPGYGFQWRHSGAEYKGMEADYTGQGVDQLESIITLLKSDPDSRRMLMCAWVPPYLAQMALPPCHILYQVYTHICPVTGRRLLSAKMYQRSADAFLGVPFNITSYALLTHIVAELTGCVANELIMTFGDFHIYQNHIEQVKQQLSRAPRAFPKIEFRSNLSELNIADITEKDFTIVGYSPYGHIPAPMAV
jgi:thymidylate synthase